MPRLAPARLALAALIGLVSLTPARAQEPPVTRPPAPDLVGGTDWINSAGPLKLADLKGKVVVLDFWTLCCINCIHVMPDLAKLEKKYPNDLVVVGVHSPKFDNERETKSIRKAVLRYEIAHPVVNDADRKIWDAYNVQSWPTMAVIDPEGKLVGTVSGEGNFELIDKVVAKLVAEAKGKGTLKSGPMRFDLARYRETGDTPLFFPGKILADPASDRLFVSDSTHHRVVVSTLAGKLVGTVGTGTPGKTDGPAAKAQFDDPQGLALDGDTLYVADRKNHSLRAVDLKAMTVRTVAGTGEQSQASRALAAPAPALKTGLNSPWGLTRVGRDLFIAMAGHHQIWKLNLDAATVAPFAGEGGENLRDGPPGFARFAQPSGLTADDKFLYVADSEVSAVRKVPLSGEGFVETIVGEGLFTFGDVDGKGEQVRLQHALGLGLAGGKLIVADTYNSKLKRLDPASKECHALPLKPAAGESGPLFNEPAGLSVAGGKVYVADTNAHRVRVVDLDSNAVTTLTIAGLTPPPVPKEWQAPASTKK